VKDRSIILYTKQAAHREGPIHEQGLVTLIDED